MAVIKTNANDRKLLARLIRAEAEGEGELGMLLVANVCVNRVRVGCLDFVDINSIERMVWQSPGGFEAVHFPYFYQRAREKEIRLAERAINGERHRPAEFALWFFRPEGPCPEQWWGQWNSGRYKEHCFYIPIESDCPDVYGVY
ncbi:cell wall hydrolase [Halalkalibacter krulwichiae]|uniref:Cell wall hydrolase CwlJ n=2 Tax=Halalkalibacter krulwichiae TaxID=199441 RepID=A0A1X9MF53_9BACI|nr:cell wall hydrolase [Halalkalibacter krulwichiae]ARK29690.1 Cell wall hydrolase CwlJ [Halalkalibacter krulwichiae]ARK31274.1 Cell wall hydrolase CwlJ [Halalkalibacter krulwichiae]